ncbi:hypothetical protein [Roseinatronobacter thiooxidans]|nr:hypothetical protein [Roseinatronobacter thiooxidans]
MTVDWVVLGAATVGMGISSAVVVRNGSEDLGQRILNSLNSVQVGEMTLNIGGLSGIDPAVIETYSTSLLSGGRVQTDVYVDGQLVRTEITDPQNTHDWENIVRHFDENGQMVSEHVNYDDGRIRNTFFEDGVRTAQDWSDPNNAHAWKTIDVTYDEQGRMLTRLEVLNNNHNIADQHVDGRLVERVRSTPEGIITSTEAHSYVLAENGQQLERRIDYSDGRILNTIYENGRAVSQTVTDPDNSHNWTNQNWTWNEQGQVASHNITNNDGTRNEHIYADGRVAMTNRFDANNQHVSTEERGYDAAGRLISLTDTGVNGVFVRNETRTLDAAGRLIGQNISHADGRQVVIAHENGVRTEQTITHAQHQHGYATEVLRFDQNDRIAERTVTRTNGTSYLETRDQGRISHRTEFNAAGNVVGTSDWTYQVDEFNRIQLRNINHSDGRQSVTTYSGIDRPVQQTVVDVQNRHWWSDQVTSYDSMGRISNTIVNYNDGRQYEDIYVVGIRTQRIFRDVDGNVTSTESF